MIIFEDTRNQIGKHSLKHEWFKNNGVEVKRTKLYAGDYTLPTNQSVCIDSKMSILEVINDVQADHVRFRAEMQRAAEAGIKLYILVENQGCYIDYRQTRWNPTVRCIEDLNNWTNPRLLIMKKGGIPKYPKAMKGTQIAKICKTMEERYGCKFVFCRPDEAGKMIVEILTKGEVNG